MRIHEIEIPVPWGIIAAKTWGDKKDPLIIAVHGWSDNANSFDPLIPHLSNTYYYCCIDLPGHGKSSAVQASLFTHYFDFMLVIKLVHHHFMVERKQRKFIYLTHSLGSQIVVTFSQLYPEYVSKLIMLDVFHFYVKGATTYYERKLKYLIDNRMKHLTVKNTAERRYDWKEAIQKIAVHRITPISPNTAGILAERCLEKSKDGKYRFLTSDLIKFSIHPLLSVKDILELVQLYPVKCPHLIILSTNSTWTKIPNERILKEYEKNKNFEFHIVTGNHQVHMENPEAVADIINPFLSKGECKL